MEGAPNIYKPKQEESKTDIFEIFNSSLVGKSEEQLTPEQKTLEERFIQENLEKFIDLIDQDKIMVHATSASVSVILKEGILARTRLRSKGADVSMYDELDSWQEKVANDITGPRLKAFLDIHRKWVGGEVSQEEYKSKIEEILENAPEPGRARLEHFFRKVVPKLEQRGFLSEDVRPFLASRLTGLNTDSTRLFKDPTKDNYPPPRGFSSKRTVDEAKKLVFTGELANIIAGPGLISASDASYMKMNLYNKGGYRTGLLDSAHGSTLGIYFDKPDDDKQLYQISARMGGENFDTSIASKVGPWHFRALRFGIYDRSERTLYLQSPIYSIGEQLTPKTISASDIPSILGLQEKGLLFFDRALTPLPPLASIRIVDAPLKEDAAYEEQFKEILKENEEYSNTRVIKILEHKGYTSSWRALADEYNMGNRKRDRFHE